MSRRSIVCTSLTVVLLAANPLILRSADPAPAGAVIQQYCTGCHNAKLKTAGLVLDVTDLEHIEEHSVIWERWIFT